jgi:ribonucleoside-triphosphate reductase
MARDIAAIEKDIAETTEALNNVKGSETEVYARIVGYYRSLKNWNKGKKDEFAHRKTFRVDEGTPRVVETGTLKNDAVDATAEDVKRYELFARKTCPNCPPVKDYLAHSGLEGVTIDVDNPEGLQKAMALNVISAPTVILYGKGDTPLATLHTVDDLDAMLNGVAA